MSPRYPSMPWISEAVATAEWTGTPLRHVLDRAGLLDDAVDIAFIGADRGFDRGHEHAYGRSLRREAALSDDVLLVWAMNGAPLLPQHGFPLRLIVPGWYGMASVKWLARIEAIEAPFDGQQQAVSYHTKQQPDERGVPCTHMRVKSLMAPPGIPDFYDRRRTLDAGRVRIAGRAWSGNGVAVTRVEFAVDGAWRDAQLEDPQQKWSWQRWEADWDAEPGEHELACRATDAAGNVQPQEPVWDMTGFCNNSVQRARVTVR
jgi:DMSO/TMAO reductase YedYZ molybdopterin-dependent catalytic subunit